MGNNVDWCLFSVVFLIYLITNYFYFLLFLYAIHLLHPTPPKLTKAPISSLLLDLLRSCF